MAKGTQEKIKEYREDLSKKNKEVEKIDFNRSGITTFRNKDVSKKK